MENKTKEKANLSRFLWLFPLLALVFLCAVAGLRGRRPAARAAQTRT